MGKALPPAARESRRALKAASDREEEGYRPGGARRSMPQGQQGAPAGPVTGRQEAGHLGGGSAKQGGTAWLQASSLLRDGAFFTPINMSGRSPAERKG